MEVCSSATGCASARWSWLKKNIAWMPATVSILRRLMIIINQHTNVQMTDMMQGNMGESVPADLSGLEWNSKPYEKTSATSATGKELT